MKINKNILLFKILFTIMVSMVLLPANNTFAAQFEGKGTEESPYLIRTEEEMCNVGTDYQSASAYYKLMNDLDFKYIPRNFIVRPYFLEGSIMGFMGHFDGDGHTIKGINIQNSSYAGLFSYVDVGVTIKNIILEDPVIRSDKGYAGAICGYAGLDTNITNCYVIRGNVTGYSEAGGIVGKSDDALVNISQCYSNSNVNAVNGVAGGLIGSAYTRMVINQSCSTGSVKAAVSAGGIVGKAIEATCEIDYCYSLNDLQSPKISGIGDNIQIRNSYSASTANGSSISGIGTGGNIVNSFFDSTLLGINTPESLSRTTEQMYQMATYPGWDFDNIWYIEEGEDYPRLKFSEKLNGFNSSQFHVVMQPEEKLDFSVYMAGKDVELVWFSSNPEIASVNSSGEVKAKKEGNITLFVQSTDNLYTETIKVNVINDSTIPGNRFLSKSVPLLEGEGTEESPFLIRTVEDFNSVNDSSYGYYKLMNDLDFEYKRDYNSISEVIFDGNGHTIERLATPLFHYIGFSEVKNLKLKNVTLSFGMGALANYASLSTISNCNVENATIITASNVVGGLIGKIEGTNVNNCYLKEGTITASKGKVGGLVGLTSKYYGFSDIYSNINQCYFTGILNNSDPNGYTGGLSGQSDYTNYNQCFAISEINSEGQAGGLIGSMETLAPFLGLTDCYSMGSINSNISFGNTGMVDKGILFNCYSANIINQERSKGLSNNTEGIYSSYFDSTLFSTGKSEPQARSTEEMYKISNYPWDFNNVWYIEEGKDYPRLRFSKPVSDIPVVKSTYLRLDPGEQLTYTIDNENWKNHEMIWSSSDPDIVSVDQSGLITAVKAGNTIIIVKSSDCRYVEKLQVIVSDIKYWITVELDKGKTCRLETEKPDQKDQRLSVKNPSVATVSQEGEVTAIAPGLTKITARKNDGSSSGQLYIKVR